MAKRNIHFSIKKLLLLGFLFVVLLAIPLTVYLVQQQQESRSQAVKSTTLSFTPPTATAQLGEILDFDIVLSPGTNQVNLVRLVIKFDPTKLSATEQSFTLDSASGLSVLQGPVLGTDTLSVVLSVGSDPTKVIETVTKIGSVSFEVIGGPSTEVSFDPTTEISSTDGGDSFSENVFLSGSPASITIEGGEGASPTPTGVQTLNTSPTPTISGASGNSAPVCTVLGFDVSTTGIAPYTITFNASGSDSDGTVEAVTFTFEPSFTEEVATESGISGDSVEVSATHTYQTPGNYTATAVLTDDQGAISDSADCSVDITITDENGNIDSTSTSDDSDSDSETSTTPTDVTPSPLPATGPAETVVGFGILGGILLLIGTLLFFAL